MTKRVATMAAPTWMPVAAAASAGSSFMRRGPASPASKGELPRLLGQFPAEGVMPSAPDQPEARGLVDPPGRHQDALRPERDLAVADLACEAHALVDEPDADAEAARLRIDDEQPQLGHRARLPDQEHRAHHPTVLLGDPAPVRLRIAGADESRRSRRRAPRSARRSRIPART